MKKLSLLSGLLAAALLVGAVVLPPMPVAAKSVQQQIKDLEDEQEDLKKELAAAKDVLADSKAKRQNYINQINNVRKQITLLDNQVESYNQQIEAKNAEIAVLEQEIAENHKQEEEIRKTLGERLNALAKRGNFSTFQMLMNTESYTDYLIKAKLMEKIAEADQQAIDELEAALVVIAEKEEKIEQEKQGIKDKIAAIEANRKSSNVKKKELDGLYAAANKVYQKDQAEVNAINREMQQTEDDIKRLLNSINSTGVYTTMYWPVPTVRAISSGYGKRWGKLHKGIDVANGPIPVYGQNIVAAADGTVIRAIYNSWGGGYGYHCVIEHGKDKYGRVIATLYAHCSKLYAKVGQKVIGGKTVIGQAGDTGNVTGPHLHFEVWVNGTPVDPIKEGYVSVKGK